MIAGIALILVSINSKTQISIKEKGCLLSFHFRFLNFSEHIGISAINNNDITTPKASIIKGFPYIGITIKLTSIIFGKSGKWYIIIGNKKNEAFAGVGKPINEEVCLVSILNLAKRMAENTGIVKAK